MADSYFWLIANSEPSDQLPKAKESLADKLTPKAKVYNKKTEKINDDETYFINVFICFKWVLP